MAVNKSLSHGAAGPPRPSHWLEPADFEQVIRHTPLIAIDLLARSPEGKILLGRRKNEPAKGALFTVGGRIGKNESRAMAFKRISRDELGIERTIDQARFCGVYEHFYDTNVFGKPGLSTHYLTLAYELFLVLPHEALPRDQHGDYVWLTEAELLANPEVHENAKAFFR